MLHLFHSWGRYEEPVPTKLMDGNRYVRTAMTQRKVCSKCGLYKDVIVDAGMPIK